MSGSAGLDSLLHQSLQLLASRDGFKGRWRCNRAFGPHLKVFPRFRRDKERLFPMAGTGNVHIVLARLDTTEHCLALRISLTGRVGIQFDGAAGCKAFDSSGGALNVWRTARLPH